MRNSSGWSVVEAGAESFVKSELFARTFREGMTLVEETADYLDGAGRVASKGLGRAAALAYAGASMRLTTQLMQIASWLLVLRAVREGEMSIAEARDEKYRLRPPERDDDLIRGEGVPDQLITLTENTGQIYARIVRLDSELFIDGRDRVAGRDAAAQIRTLRKAFGQ